MTEELHHVRIFFLKVCPRCSDLSRLEYSFVIFGPDLVQPRLELQLSVWWRSTAGCLAHRPARLAGRLALSVGSWLEITVGGCHDSHLLWAGTSATLTAERKQWVRALVGRRQRLLVLVGWDPAYWDSNIDIPLSHHATPHYLIVLALSLHNLHLHHLHHHHHHHPLWGHHCYISGVFCTALLWCCRM